MNINNYSSIQEDYNFKGISGCEVTTFLELSQIKSLDFKLISCKLQIILFVITVCRFSSEGTTESLEQSYGKCGDIIWSCKHKGKTVNIFNVLTYKYDKNIFYCPLNVSVVDSGIGFNTTIRDSHDCDCMLV